MQQIIVQWNLIDATFTGTGNNSYHLKIVSSVKKHCTHGVLDGEKKHILPKNVLSGIISIKFRKYTNNSTAIIMVLRICI